MAPQTPTNRKTTTHAYVDVSLSPEETDDADLHHHGSVIMQHMIRFFIFIVAGICYHCDVRCDVSMTALKTVCVISFETELILSVYVNRYWYRVNKCVFMCNVAATMISLVLSVQILYYLQHSDVSHIINLWIIYGINTTWISATVLLFK